MRTVSRSLASKPLFPEHASELALLALLAFAFLWKGGKTLETTWLLALVAAPLTLFYWKSRRKSLNLKRESVPRILWTMLILSVFWGIVSALSSQTMNYGLDEILRDASLALVFLWAYRTSSSAPVFLNTMMTTIGQVTLLCCLIGTFVYLLQPVDRFVGTFFDLRFHTDYWPNAWAEQLLLVWPIVLLWLSGQSGNRLFRRLASGFLIGCLLLSYSRGALAAFALQLALGGGLLLWRGSSQWGRLATEAAITVGVALAVFGGLNAMRALRYPVQSVTARATFSSPGGTSSITERRDFWRQSMVLASKKPLVGWGPYSFRFVQPRLQQAVLQTSDHPHNVILKILVERGVFPAILFILFFASILTRALLRLLTPSREGERDFLPVGVHAGDSVLLALFLGLVGVLAHSMIDYNLQFVGIALPFWLFAGIVAAYSFRRAPILLAAQSWRQATAKRLTEVVLASVLFLTAVIEGGSLVLSSLGRHAEARGDDATALSYYATVASREWFSRDLHLSRAQLHLKRGQLREAEKAIDDYLRENDEDARAWKLKGDIVSAARAYREARPFYERASELGKFNDLSITRALLLGYQAADQRAAIDGQKDDILALTAAFGQAILRNDHFIALSQNVEEFSEVTKILAKLYPGERERLDALGTQVMQHAEEERAKIKARKPGVLW